MSFIIIAIIILFVLQYNKQIDARKFIEDTEPYFRFLMEVDYKLLLTIKYGIDVDVNKSFVLRVRNGLIIIIVLFFLFLSKLNFISIIVAIIVGYVFFKLPYTRLQANYRQNLYKINLLLPYYLKGLEILIQHYTVPVALGRSVESAPEIFKPGLRKLTAKIEEGDSTVDPYMDFAKEYPVRDSMRMMRLLYRLGLGSGENKHEQLLMFSKTVSSLQNKSREQKYKDRLDKMEGKTMQMLFVTGGGVLVLMLFAMMMLMNI
jgi:hypothetical protein